MTEIQQNRYDQLIRRVNNIVSPGSMVGDALNELFPMIDVETPLLELSFLAGTRHAFATAALPALAANLNHFQMFNPANSGMLVVLERVDIHVATAQSIRFDTTTTPLTNSSANHRLRDTREAVTQLPVGQVRDVQQVGGLPIVGSIFVRVNETLSIADSKGLFVLAPGSGVTFAHTIVNISGEVLFWWRERVAEAAELNF